MATASLSAAARANSGKGAARKLRSAGQIPGIVYGHARTPQPLALDARELERLLDQVSAETTVIELAVDGSTSRTLIREIQRHPVKRNIIHVDFQELVAGEKVTVKIPIILNGIPAGVRVSGGIMSQVLQELECLVDPSNIPSRIDVDVTEVTIGHSLHVSDITVPEGLEVLDDSTATIVTVSAPKAVEEAPVAEAAAAAPAEPELIRKPKAEDEVPEK